MIVLSLNSQQLVSSERDGRYVSAGAADSAMRFGRQLNLLDIGGLRMRSASANNRLIWRWFSMAVSQVRERVLSLTQPVYEADATREVASPPDSIPTARAGRSPNARSGAVVSGFSGL